MAYQEKKNTQNLTVALQHPVIAGTLELDLRNLVAPAKTPEKCSLIMMDDLEIGAPKKNENAKSLFAQQSVRGWWPCYIEKDGKKTLGVSMENRKFTLI